MVEARVTVNMTSKRISVVIPVYRGEAFIEACLASVTAQAPVPSEIITVDDASPDASAQRITERFPQVRLLRNDTNHGFAYTVNIGLRAARDADFVFVLNQDAVLNAGCLEALLDSFATYPALGIAGCKIFYPDGHTMQHAGAFVDRPSAFSHHYGYQQADDGRWGEDRSVEYVTGAAMLISRAALDTLGGFDESISPMYYEDVDLCFSARKLGFDVRYVSKAILTHQESTTQPTNSYFGMVNFFTGRLSFVLKQWSKQDILACLDEERTAVAISPSLDETLARSRACARVMNKIGRLRATHAASCSHPIDAQSDDAFWRSVVERLRDARNAGLRHMFALVRDQGADDVDIHTSGVMDRAATRADLRRQGTLKEFNFVSKAPIVGAIRSALHGIAGRWALRYVVHQQSEVNQTLIAAIEGLEMQLLELTFALGERADRTGQSEPPALSR